MKHSIIILAAATILFAGCKEQIVKPNASFTVDKTEIETYEMVTFTFTGQGTQKVIFTGDNGHRFDQKSATNTGVVMTLNTFNHTYTDPGEYTVAMIASSYGDMGELDVHDTCYSTIKVKDSDCALQSVYARIYYDFIYAVQEGENWVLRLPQEVWANVMFVSTALKQKMTITAASANSTILFNGATFDLEKKQDLSKVNDITVISDAGEQKTYKLTTMYYPDFENFSLASVPATIEREQFNLFAQHVFDTLPAGTDVTALAPTFSLIEGQKVMYNGTEVISGMTKLDWTNPVILQVINTTADGQYEAVSNIEVIVTIKEEK